MLKIADGYNALNSCIVSYCINAETCDYHRIAENSTGQNVLVSFSGNNGSTKYSPKCVLRCKTNH